MNAKAGRNARKMCFGEVFREAPGRTVRLACPNIEVHHDKRDALSYEVHGKAKTLAAQNWDKLSRSSMRARNPADACTEGRSR